MWSKKMRKILIAVAVLSVFAAGVVAANEADQVNEAAAVFDGVKPSEMRGDRILERDRSVIAPQHYTYDEDWILNGESAWKFIRQIRARKNLPREFNAVAEYNPPFAFATQVQAELFWNSDESWEEIAKRARMRSRPER